MLQRLFAALMLLLVLPSALHAQAKPVDLSLGWTYQYADQGNGFANLNGWYGSLNWELTKTVGLTFEHESYWGEFMNGGINQHAWLAGATVNLRKGNPKIMPFLQPMAGGTRSSSSGTIQWEPTLQLALGANITLKGKLALQLIPAIYNYTHGNGSNLNSYEAGAGLQYTLGQK